MSPRPPASSEAGGGPDVVVGLTSPRPDDVPVRDRESMLERMQEVERAERARDKHLVIVHDDLESEAAVPAAVPVEPPAVAAPKPRLELASVEMLAAEPAPPEAAAPAEPPVHEAPAAAAALPAPEAQTQHAPAEEADEPDASSLVARASSRRIEEAAGAPADEPEWDPIPASALRKHMPEVAERRARFARYVRWAVAGGAVVCLAAAARTLLTAPPAASLGTAAAPSAPVAIAAALEGPSATVKAALAPSAASTRTNATEPSSTALGAAEAPSAQATPSGSAAPPSASAPSPAPGSSSATEVPTAGQAVKAVDGVARSGGRASAVHDKNLARRALEAGRVSDAIAAGERSVAADPTDGEAWLLLGAAYQEKGSAAQARRCYTSCLQLGKRGPLGECSAMLR